MFLHTLIVGGSFASGGVLRFTFWHLFHFFSVFLGGVSSCILFWSLTTSHLSSSRSSTSLSVMAHTFCPFSLIQYCQACFQFPCLSLYGSSCLIVKKSSYLFLINSSGATFLCIFSLHICGLLPCDCTTMPSRLKMRPVIDGSFSFHSAFLEDWLNASQWIPRRHRLLGGTPSRASARCRACGTQSAPRWNDIDNAKCPCSLTSSYPRHLKESCLTPAVPPRI